MNNNPFEEGNNSSPFEAGEGIQINSSQPKKVKKNKKKQSYNNAFHSKKKGKPAIVIIVILVIVAIIVAANWWKIRMFFFELEHMNDVKGVEVVEDYKFDPKDVADDEYQTLLDIKVGQGKDFTITETNEDLFVNSDGGLEGAFVVGRDIEPGVYTLTVSGNGYLNMDTTLRTYFDIPYEGENVYYNVPLVKGDKIEINTFDTEEAVTIDLTTQSEYVDYVPDTGMLGVYVYGLSNFNPEVSLNKNDYNAVIYGYPKDGYDDYMTSEYLYDQSVTLNGGVSTYFIVQ